MKKVENIRDWFHTNINNVFHPAIGITLTSKFGVNIDPFDIILKVYESEKYPKKSDDQLILCDHEENNIYFLKMKPERTETIERIEDDAELKSEDEGP